MCVCVCVYVCVCVCVCMYVCMYVCACVCLTVCIHTHTHTPHTHPITHTHKKTYIRHIRLFQFVYRLNFKFIKLNTNTIIITFNKNKANTILNARNFMLILKAFLPLNE